MATPHIAANKGDIAPFVLMPGDPLRAEYIAKTFLTDVVCYSRTRCAYGFTGNFGDFKVSVQTSGMGCPSMGIYSYELFNFYDVQTIVRVGTIGGIANHLKLRDIVIAQSVSTNSNYLAQYNLPGNFAPTADFSLLSKAVAICEKMGINPNVGNILTSDTFYDVSQSLEKWKSMGVLGVEMETAALYANATYATNANIAYPPKKALAVFTVSDLPLKGEVTSADERETAFNTMIRIALECIA
jgi:purine-nucleoside phosphorylase